MGPEALAQVLRPLSEVFDPAGFPDLLMGLEPPDDAAVWRLDGDRALVLSSDFFPPVVDDPYQFGAIAAANSLSDLYAMGAEPLMAINLVGFPEDLDRSILAEILRGGAEKVREAGAVIAGGHTTADKEPKYGLAVTGLVHPDRVWTKAGARPDDVLYLTKPLGTGLMTTALRNDAADAGELAQAVESMVRLHRRAVALLRQFGEAVHAVTDVTGFSFAGHGQEMAQQSGLSLCFEWAAVPQLRGARSCAEQGHRTGGARRNEAHYGSRVREPDGWAQADRDLLYDPQTSGGLLLAVVPSAAGAIEEAFGDAGEPLWRVGRATAGDPGTVVIS